jgi:parallel beta-helix repeat protein
MVLSYVVTSTADSGSGTLRDAINQVNANPGAYGYSITFNIASSGVQTINLLSALPAVTVGGITINGLTEMGATFGSPLVQLNGASAGASASGLELAASSCEVEGLIISGFGGDGIGLDSNAPYTQLYSNFIGTNAAGTAAQGNGGYGIAILSSNNQIGSSGFYRNIISGNAQVGIVISSGSAGSNNVQGNYVGTNAAGTAIVANGGDGIDVLGGSNLIGGAAGYGNVFSGNNGEGILVYGSSSGNQVLGNSVGTNAAGTAALANTGDGIYVSVLHNTIGGTTTSARNLISGNGGNGILLDRSALYNQVLGNYIGLNSSASGLGNSGNGIVVNDSENTLGGTTSGATNFIYNNGGDGILVNSGANGTLIEGNRIVSNTLNGVEISSIGNTIGGTTTGARNLISFNGQDGVLLNNGATNDFVQGDFIGTDSGGSLAQGNAGNGVEVVGNNNYIGYYSGPHLVIAANGGDGILLDSSAMNNLVVGTYVGINFAGTAGVGNSTNGIEVLGTSNSIGSSVSGGRNLISGNFADGILLGSSASSNAVQDNSVGINTNASAAVGNSGNGVEVLGSSNTIGGATAVYRNIISGNALDGILLGGAGHNNPVQANFIGLNAIGTTAFANSGNGIEVAQSNDTIGGTTTAARNVVSANAQDGILLDSGVSGIVVQGNYIGTNASGTAGVGNSANGIEVLASGNTIGGIISGQRNIVSGNLFDGILLGSGVTGTAVQGNYIGTNNAGTAALANSSNGIEVDGANNSIGGTTAAARNIISGNSLDGVFIAGGATGVAVQGDYLGTNAAGSAAVGNGTGVEVAANAATIGGLSAASRNLVSGNSGDGVTIDSGVSGAVVQGNYIGVNSGNNAALGNSGYGVNVAGTHTLIGGSTAAAANIIANNATGGVNLSAGSGNTVRRNAIYANGATQVGPGIILASGANNNLSAPTISTATLAGSVLTVTGTFSAPTANVPYVLEFFVSPAGDPEGKIYVGSKTVIPSSTGTQAFTFKASTAAATNTTLITATLTDNLGDTSAFSNAVTS